MRSKFQDFCSDLEGATEMGIVNACIAYRRDAKSEFFPKPGQLLGLCRDDINERRKRLDALDRVQEQLGTAEIADAPPDEAEIERRRTLMQDAIAKMRVGGGVFSKSSAP